MMKPPFAAYTLSGGTGMKKRINLWQGGGFVFTIIAGTLLHFLYEWLGKPVWLSPFSGVNESTWEHMKLLFFPMLIFAIAQSFFFKDRQNFWCVKLRGILLGLVLIPVIFYTYNNVIAKSPDWMNVLIFIVTSAAAYLYEKRLLEKDLPHCEMPFLPQVFLALITLCFIVFTFKAPPLNVFRDPLTGTFGLFHEMTTHGA